MKKKRCRRICVDRFAGKNLKSVLRVLQSVTLVGALLFAVCVRAEAQEERKIFWIGYLAGSGSSPNPAFVQGMLDLGYVEGKNIAFVYRAAEGRRERYADLAAELVRLKVDVIVTDVSAAGRALKKATNRIPIVMTSSTDPVADGLVASLARPGGNVTGLTNIGAELGGKQLELLKEITPKLNRVAVLGTSQVFFKETETPARALGIQLLGPLVKGPDDIDGAFRIIAKERIDGVLMRLQPSLFSAHRKRVAELTTTNRLPAIANSKSWVDAGGLMSYGSDLNFQYRRAAVFVDKILKGTSPADLPVERPSKYELAINLRTAKQIGLIIPPNVLARADRVIR
jgi:putative ABC transport system substrate-binding protein